MNRLMLLALATVAQAAEPISEEEAVRDLNAAGRLYARMQLTRHHDDYECFSQPPDEKERPLFTYRPRVRVRESVRA